MAKEKTKAHRSKPLRKGSKQPGAKSTQDLSGPMKGQVIESRNPVRSAAADTSSSVMTTIQSGEPRHSERNSGLSDNRVVFLDNHITGLDSSADKSKPSIGEGEKVVGLPAMPGEERAKKDFPTETVESAPTTVAEVPPVPDVSTTEPPATEDPVAEESQTESPETSAGPGSLPMSPAPPAVTPLHNTPTSAVNTDPGTTASPEADTSAETETVEEESVEDIEGKEKSPDEFSPGEQKELAAQTVEDSNSRLLENSTRLAELSGKSVSYRLPKRLLFRKEKRKYRQVQADFLAHNFIASSIQKGQDLIAYADAAKPRLEVAAEIAKANISAAVQEQVLATQTNTDLLKAQVTADAERLRMHVNQYYFGTVSTIKANTRAQLQKIENEWQTTQKLVEDQRTGQLKFVDEFHLKGKQSVIDVGNQVGFEAFALGRVRARYHRSQQQWENGSPKSDGMLDGPYTFNVLEAKAKAAEGVGESYQTSFQEKGVEISQDADKGKPEDIKAANDTVKEVNEKLLEFYNSSVQGLKDQEKTMLGQAASTRSTFLTNINDAEKNTLESLEAQNSQQISGLLGLEERQHTAVDRNTLNTLNQLNEEIIAATTEIANGLDLFIQSQDGQLVPDPDQLAMDLAEKSNRMSEVISGIIAGFETSVANVEASITTGGESAITLITTFGQNGIANAQKTVDDIQPGFAQLEEGATNTFLKMRQSHLEMALKTSKDVKDGLSLSVGKLKEGFTKLRGEMNKGMADMKKNLRKGFREAMLDPKEGIWPTMYEVEKEEADKVEPRWKKVLKVLAIIVIIIVVIVLSVVTMGAAVPFLVGAGMSVAAATVVAGVVVGAIGGALMTMGMNLVNGRPIMEGVGKAMLIGAIGGAFGGIGGVVASKVVGTATTIGARVLTFSIEGVFDIAGGIIGDLAAGDLTWQGVLQGFGTGVGIQLVLGRFMKGAKPDINLKPDVDVPKTKLGEVNVKVKTKLSKAQQKFGGFMDNLGNVSEQAGKNFRAKVTGKQAKVDLDGLEIPAVKLDTPTPKTEPVVKPDPDIKVKPESEVPTVKPEAETRIKPEPETVKPESDGNVEMGFGGKKNRTHPDAEADAEGIVSRKPVKGADGQDHEVKVTKKGEILRCSTCDEIEGHYKAELDAPENVKLKQELEQIRLEPDPEVKAQRAQEVAEKLESFKRSKGMDSEHGQETKIKETPEQTPRQKKFQEEIDTKLKNGEIDEDMARKLAEYNRKNPSGKRSIDSAIGEFKAGKELGETGHFRDPGAGTKELPDVPAHSKPGAELPVTKDIADVKAKTEAELKQIESDIKAKSESDVDYQNKKAESFENRHPEAQSKKEFEDAFEKRNGKLEDATDKEAYIKKRKEQWERARQMERETHSDLYDQGEISRLKGDAFEKHYAEAMGDGWHKPGSVEGEYPDGTHFRRNPDLMKGDHMQELKSGPVSMSDSVMAQILKDASFIQQSQKQVTWVFMSGASKSVLNQLKKYGINYKLL